MQGFFYFWSYIDNHSTLAGYNISMENIGIGGGRGIWNLIG